MRRGLKERGEFVLAYSLLKTFGFMPRRIAGRAAQVFAWCGFRLAQRQRRVGMRNLAIAFPEKSRSERDEILHACFRNIGRLLVEFSHFPELTGANIHDY